MIEYAILIRNGNAEPYYLEKYNTFDSAKSALETIVEFEEKRLRPYFVDNDFFVNKYPPLLNAKYLCIVSREVTSYKNIMVFIY